MDRYPISATVNLDLTITSAGIGVTGQSPVVVIRRQSDGFYYDDQLASGSRFAVDYATNAATEVDATNIPGLYLYSFDHSEDATGSEYFFVRFINNSIVNDKSIAFGRLQSATAPDLCSLYGTVLDINGAPDMNKQVRVSTVHNEVLATGARPAMSVDKVDTFTDTQGMFAINVVRGLTVRLQISSVGYDRKIAIPDAASANFADL